MELFFFGIGLAFLLPLGLLVVSRQARLATSWSMLLALALGVWFIAPREIDRHFLSPRTGFQWALIDGFLLATFLGLGAGLGALTSVPLAVYGLVRRKVFRCDVMATGLWSLATLPVAYLVLSALIEVEFLKFSGLREFAPWLSWALVLYALTVTALAGAYRSWGRQQRDWRLGRATASLLCATAAGILVLPWRIDASLGKRQSVPPLVRHQSGDSARAPLLVIGLDGADWRTLEPVIASGAAPTLARLLGTGSRGRIEALWPPYWSTPAWGAILTGHSMDEIGVHSDLAATVRFLPPFELPLTLDAALNPLFVVEQILIHAGLIVPGPASRDQLLVPPIWERLTEAGVRTATIHFPFSFPAEDQAAYVVSDRVVTDLWEMLGVAPGPRTRIVSPQARANRLLAWFSGPNGTNPGVLSQILPEQNWPQPKDALVNPTAVLGKVLDSGQRMFAVTDQIVTDDPSLSAVFLYITDLDTVCHSFWPYRHPEDFPDDPPAPEDVRVLGPVIDRYVATLDQSIATLVGSFPRPPNVLIVADHGEGPGIGVASLWRGWHSRFGAVLASGPDIVRRSDLLEVSYYDIVPTILKLEGFDKAADLRGKSMPVLR